MALEKAEFKFPDEVESKKEKNEAENDEIIVEMESDSEDAVDVEVVDDTPTKDRNRKPSEPPPDLTEDELKDYSDKVRKRIQHFSKGYHDERRAKEAALREREELERLTAHLVEENKKLKGTVNKNQEVLLEQAKKEVAAEIEAAKRAYKQAYDAGDADAIIAAQEALTGAKLKSDRVENFKFTPEEDEGTAVPEPRKPVVDTRAASWAKENPWFGQDDEMTSYALGLHNKLVKDKVDPKSDEYYEIIDSRMRKLFPDRFNTEDEEQESAPKPRRKANVVAPATRSTAPKKIVLNPRQVALAKKYGIPLQQYALEVAKLGREE